MDKHTTQRGNVLFLILIAVVLFAALSYAVTTSNRGGGNADTEQVELKISQMMNYIASIRSAILRLSIKGVEDSQFCFDSALWGHADYNSAGCSNDINKIFSSSGGVNWSTPVDGINDGSPWEITDGVAVEFLNVPATGNPEITMILPNIPFDVCRAINEYVGLPYSGSAVPIGLVNFDFFRFDGGYVLTEQLGYVTNSDPAIHDKDDFCFEETGTGDYFYITVLKRR
jgi:hypothetical protein